MTFTGSVDACNYALYWAGFTPTPLFTGAASFTVETNDLGNTGSGGPKIDTDTITITVA